MADLEDLSDDEFDCAVADPEFARALLARRPELAAELAPLLAAARRLDAAAAAQRAPHGASDAPVPASAERAFERWRGERLDAPSFGSPSAPAPRARRLRRVVLAAGLRAAAAVAL